MSLERCVGGIPCRVYALTMGWRTAVKDALDRPSGRWALMPLATAQVTLRERVPCLVWPTEGGWVHRYREGTFARGEIGARPPRHLDGDAREIFLFACSLHEGDTVLDIGAGAGEEVRTFSDSVGSSGRVIAVEAHPVTYSLLVRNCSYGRLHNVESVHRAITDRSDVVYLTDHGASIANRLSRSEDGVSVPSSSLDELADELQIGRVALLKMNIEGAERIAIQGMDRLIERTDCVCISCHDFLVTSGADESMRTKDVVAKFLRDRGFTVRTRDDDPRPWVRDYLYGTRPGS